MEVTTFSTKTLVRSRSNKARKSRRRKTKNMTNESKKSITTSVDIRNATQKNVNQTSCASVPNPLRTLTCLAPTSLYTSPLYHVQSKKMNFQRYNEFSKLLPSEQWGVVQSNSYSTIPAILCRHPRVQKPIATPHYYSSEETCTHLEDWNEHSAKSVMGRMIVTPRGTISLRLHNKLRVDMTIDRAIRVINSKNNIILSLSSCGFSSALLHPNGRIYQHGSRVEILTHDANGNNKYAKMWYKGVSFTSEQCALVYLVDAAGTRTTTDSFSDLSQDFSLNVFYTQSRYDLSNIQEVTAALSNVQYWLADDGVENWIINNVRISQTPDGLVRIARNSNKYQLRTSPSNGTASLTTPFLHCTASLGQTSHLFVRRGERRMHYDGTSFIVRNAGHSAGFDDNNQLKVY